MDKNTMPDRPLWSDDKVDYLVIEKAAKDSVYAEGAIYNLFEDIGCLKEDKAAHHADVLRVLDRVMTDCINNQSWYETSQTGRGVLDVVAVADIRKAIKSIKAEYAGEV